MKAGDQIKCITAVGSKYLTLGKIYTIKATETINGRTFVTLDETVGEFRAPRFELLSNEELAVIVMLKEIK